MNENFNYYYINYLYRSLAYSSGLSFDNNLKLWYINKNDDMIDTYNNCLLFNRVHHNIKYDKIYFKIPYKKFKNDKEKEFHYDKLKILFNLKFDNNKKLWFTYQYNNYIDKLKELYEIIEI